MYREFVIVFLITLIFLKGSIVLGQTKHETTRKVYQELMMKAEEEEDNKNYADAYKKLLKAELIAFKNEWTDELWLIKIRIGQLHLINSNFAEALENYEQSFAITQKHTDLINKGGISLANIAVLFGREENYPEAVSYYEKAYTIAKKDTSNAFKAIAVNLAENYIKLNQTSKSFDILEEVASSGQEKHDFLWEVAYIKTLFYDDQIEIAQQKAEKLYKDFKDGKYKDFRGECYVCMYKLLATIYDTPKSRKKAIQYTQNALASTTELYDEIQLYEKLIALYEKDREFLTASIYKDSLLQAKDSLTKLKNKGQYEISKVKFKTQEYINNLNIEKEQKKKQQTFFIVTVLFVLVVSFTIYRGLRNKVIRQKLLAEKQSEITELKQQRLKYEIADKNRELTAKALHLTNRNELIQDIVMSLESNDKIAENKDTAQQIKTIKNFLKTDNQQEDFIKHFENVNPVFLKRLKEKHPRLNANDIRFLCYVFMNLSLKEISTIFNITYNAGETRKRRIKEKLNLKKDDSLYDYIIRIID